jgi:hypothetical protein
MAYAYCYRINYATAAHDAQPSKLVHVDIYDTTEAASTTLVELEGADDTFTTGADNSGEDKFTPIRGHKATIQFHSTDTVNLLTFLQGDDNRFLVDAYVVSTNKRIFKGFVVQDDISQPFLPHPNVVTLTAGDGLGLLKNEPLTDSDGDVPGGHYTIIEYISWCLEKTGLELPIHVINNLKEESDQTKIMYRTCYEWAKSFEAEIGSRIDCYRVLEHILGESCYLTQYDGAWWIVRIDEIGTDAVKVNRFTYAGVWVEEYTLNTDQFIGTGKAMYWINEDATVQPERAHKQVKETYNYEYPRELINNINYERGTLIATDTVVGEEDYDTESRYALNDFIAWRRYSDKSSQSAAAIDTYIVRRFKNGYEKDRFIEITPPTSSASPWHHIESIEGTPMMAKDKFTFSVDFRFDADITGTGGVTFDIGHIRLEGVDGSIWTVDQNGYWFLAPTRRELGTAWAREDVKETDWQSYSVEVKPLPVDGEVFFALYSGQLTAADGGFQTVHYANIDLEYVPYINGGYRDYKGQYHKVSQGIASKAVRDEEVGMSDSPRPLFKGALKVYNGTKYVLAGRFYSSYHVDPPTDEHLHPYGHIQAFDVWNQHNRLMRVFEGTIQGLQVDGTLPGLIHKYRLSDITSHTVNKYFILLHGEFDWYTCEWRGTLAEVWDSSIPKDYDSTKEFKYVEG